MGDTKRGRERKHLGKESQILEEDIEYAKKVVTGEKAEEPPLGDEDEDIELDLETEILYVAPSDD
ncbi:hypothetical protein [Haloarchaeobius sp. TZWWS8]|uniref:hypothetical protein n=1 Tax=Haloarchaeobius sp. TZWWS8 TaxID=3446121 RepID=UPI003EBC73CB